MSRLVAALGCLGVLAVVSSFVVLGATHGRWGFGALAAGGVLLLLARIGAGRGE